MGSGSASVTENPSFSTHKIVVVRSSRTFGLRSKAALPMLDLPKWIFPRRVSAMKPGCITGSSNYAMSQASLK